MKLQARLQLRYDSYDNWININPILLKGELGCAQHTDGITELRIGDGETPFSKLPKFLSNFKTNKEDKIDYIDFDKII